MTQPLTGYRLRNYNHAIATLGRIRKQRKITLTALAPHLGRHRQVIGRWLLGDIEPAAPRLFELADALDCDLALIPREDS